MEESTGLGYQLDPKSNGNNHSAPSSWNRNISEGVVFVSASSQYDHVEEDDNNKELNSLETFSLNDEGCDSSNAAIVDEGEKAPPEQQTLHQKQQQEDLVPPSQPRHHDDTPIETTAVYPPPFPLPPPHPRAIASASQQQPLHDPQGASNFPSFPPIPSAGPTASPLPHFQMQQHPQNPIHSNLAPPLAPPPFHNIPPPALPSNHASISSMAPPPFSPPPGLPPPSCAMPPFYPPPPPQHYLLPPPPSQQPPHPISLPPPPPSSLPPPPPCPPPLAPPHFPPPPPKPSGPSFPVPPPHPSALAAGPSSGPMEPPHHFSIERKGESEKDSKEPLDNSHNLQSEQQVQQTQQNLSSDVGMRNNGTFPQTQNPQSTATNHDSDVKEPNEGNHAQPLDPTNIHSHPQEQADERQQQLDQNAIDAIAKAKAIAQRFQRESQATSNHNNHDFALLDPNTDYAQQRQSHFRRERLKLQTFRLKNFEYVAKHEENELRRHVDCMNRVTEWEERQSIRWQFQKEMLLEKRRKEERRKERREREGMRNEGGGGIGTEEQRLAERLKKKRGLDRGDGRGEGRRSSIYLTNLPTDGSTTERSLRELFGSYGRLDRITMYRYRSTGEYKGDGLIVFGRESVEEFEKKREADPNGGDGVETELRGKNEDLVGVVCSQMNGAELPCGTVIGVEPADMNYKNKSTGQHENANMSAVYGNTPQNEPNPCDASDKTNGGDTNVQLEKSSGQSGNGDDTQHTKIDANDGDEEDLDDFFASLV